jgi:hypothetical protein
VGKGPADPKTQAWQECSTRYTTCLRYDVAQKYVCELSNECCIRGAIYPCSICEDPHEPGETVSPMLAPSPPTPDPTEVPSDATIPPSAPSRQLPTPSTSSPALMPTLAPVLGPTSPPTSKPPTRVPTPTPTLQPTAASSFAHQGTVGLVQFCQYRSTDCTLSSGVVTASGKPEHLQPNAQCQQEAQNTCIVGAGGLRIKWVGCVQHQYLGAPDCHGVPTKSVNLSACTPQRDAFGGLPGTWDCTLMVGLQPTLIDSPSQANVLPLVIIALGI